MIALLETEAQHEALFAPHKTRVDATAIAGGRKASTHRRDFASGHRMSAQGRGMFAREAENILRTCPLVASCAVHAGSDADGTFHLVAYYVPAIGVEGSALLLEARIRRFMAGKLAPHLMPDVFICVASLPVAPEDQPDDAAGENFDLRILPDVWKAVG